ncbi:hypothetical protein NDU88_012736 [Pleurodeles waltl]|uniref:Uncharacterized protein n=1 Tax=Pleurodeles waltl TaxID=8319 RepID=A0AAV7R6T3_PLEWA|nr:hypothetical protein NDU88_012736 [Pleurodeles waltl]
MHFTVGRLKPDVTAQRTLIRGRQLGYNTPAITSGDPAGVPNPFGFKPDVAVLRILSIVPYPYHDTLTRTSGD